jgi:hypothetical protein
MNNMEESATWEDVVGSGRQRRSCRAGRFDTLVAAVLLLLLLFGWAVSLASSVERWPGAYLLTAARSPRA